MFCHLDDGKPQKVSLYFIILNVRLILGRHEYFSFGI